MKLYKPDRSNGFTVLDAQRSLSNFLIELQEVPFTAEERRLLHVILGRLVNQHTRPFFFYHFAPLLVNAVNAFFREEQRPLILDLGCGSGFASILFGLLGAKVIGIDLEPNLISACRKRQSFYETQFGPLDIHFHVADALKFDYARVGPVDGIYSLFAFNLMQPSRQLLALAISALKCKGKIVISDGNMHSLYNRLFRPRPVLTPTQLQAALLANNCRVITTQFHCIIPPIVARIRPMFHLGIKLESILDRARLKRWFGTSYTIIAEKQQA